VAAAAVLGLAAAPASAQQSGLAGLLLRFFSPSNPVVLAETGHQAHFASQASAQATLTQLNRAIASQLSTFPLGSSSGGFTYTFDPSLGVFNRATDSFGPLFAERATTTGKGKLNVGWNYLRATYDRFEGLDLGGGDIRLILLHQDPDEDGTTVPYFEGDIITADLLLGLKTDTTVLSVNYGLTERLDVGVAVPFVRVELDARIRAAVEQLATQGDPFVSHIFPDGRTQREFRESGTAEGVGDVVVRGKYKFLDRPGGGLAAGFDLRLPTGDENELLGSGAVQAKLSLIASGSGRFSPHLNLGYSIAEGGSPLVGELPDELDYTVGFDWALGRRLTLNADLIGRSLRNTERVVPVQRELHFTRRGSSRVESAVRSELVSQPGNLNLLLGAVGVKLNPFGRLLISGTVLLAVGDRGLQDEVTPVVALDYSF
jgi:hypothetical protein